MKNTKQIVALGLFSVLVLGYNNCGQVAFNNVPPSTNAAAGSPVCGLTGTESSVGLYAQTIQYIPLDPDGSSFDVAYTKDVQGNQSLAASQYSGSSGLLKDSTSDIIKNTVESFFDSSNVYVSSLNNPLYLPDINYPNIYFSKGFIDQTGTALQSGGSVLNQFFGFRLLSTFTPTWKPGVYQIATITDDGSKLTISGAATGGGNLVISNDGGHSMVMGCTDSTITITSTKKSFPLTFDYFQGPPTTIGLIALYRPVPADGKTEPLCGQLNGTPTSQYGNQGDNYFFQDSPTAPTVAEAPYKQLVAPLNQTTADSGGWAPIEAGNYNLPAGVTNPCTN